MKIQLLATRICFCVNYKNERPVKKKRHTPTAIIYTKEISPFIFTHARKKTATTAIIISQQ